MNRDKNRAGFTLIEVVLATSVSIMVFLAMGMLLTKCFSLWKDATAHWQMAQYARISRERILCGFTTAVSGGVTNLTGLLSASNAVVTSDSGWRYIGYGRIDEPGVLYQIRGWPNAADDKHVQLKRGSSSWVYSQTFGDAEPKVKIDSFSATVTNETATIAYRMRISAAGKTFTQLQAIDAHMVNKE